MPGILPMKVIKVGTSAQSRIAQACDRCRSKKIRCDGTRPTCSQCANVGFECRTSDKLSRRAFPRGYTESLEERVRQLECEIRELKDLLDEKDEKIDMLSAMHNGHHAAVPNRRRPSAASASPPMMNGGSAGASASSDTASSTSGGSGKDAQVTNSTSKDDIFRVQASPLLHGVENSDAYFMGASSGRSFITAFKRKLQEIGKPCSEFNPEAFLHVQGCPPLTSTPPEASLRIPPRLFTDRCVNVYFQEWAPLFPALHKPAFLRIYEEFVVDPEKVKCNYKLAQLYLVFSLAGLSTPSPDLDQLAACEQQWTAALDAVLLENTMSTLQCLVLALLYCTLTADYRRLQHYKAIAVGLSQRLGLHQCQKRFSFGALTLETRKKVFWTLYTIDCFSAATLGLPKMFKEEDLQAEYPSDTDDEYITEKGFQPTLPGEHTRLSSALALFRVTRILARVLDTNYPSATTYDLSIQQMSTLESELDAWHDSLPGHLKLKFVQDKPSTDVTGSRSPLLAMAYYFIRTLIYRPAVGSSLGRKAGPALMSITDSSKHIIQISELLDERGLSFSFCLNRGDLLTTCALTLLYQAIDLKQDSKLMRDSQRLINSVVRVVERLQAPGCVDLRRIASALVSIDGSRPTSPAARRSSAQSPSQKSAATSSSHKSKGGDKSRRMTMPTLSQPESDLQGARARASFDSVQSDGCIRPEDYMCVSQFPGGNMVQPLSALGPNLDYLSLSTTPSQSRSQSPGRTRQEAARSMQNNQAAPRVTNAYNGKMTGVSNTEWEALLGSMDGGMNNVYDAIYGGSSLVSEPGLTTKSSDWSPDSWDLSSFSIAEFESNPEAPQSVLSMSEESLSSGEEVSPPSMGGIGVQGMDYQKQMATGEPFNVDGMDAFLM